METGISIRIRKDLTQKQININSEFQAIAIKVTLHKRINICSIYIQPHDPIKETNLNTKSTSSLNFKRLILKQHYTNQ